MAVLYLLIATGLGSAGTTLVAPDTTATPSPRHALYLGVHSAEYGGGSHYVGLGYEWLLTPRVSVRVGVGGMHRDQSIYTVLLDPATGQYQSVLQSRGRYNSALLTSQVRYFLWPVRRAGAGLFVGAGLQLVAEEFNQDGNSPYGYVSDIQVHAPLSTRLGYQLRKGRWLLSGSAGLDFTRHRGGSNNPRRPFTGGHDVHVTSGSDLQIGFLF
ncbi:hypothetical protein [uncultured Hymenobacter sp.]|uniref:hypothetical protein n=1 Tax=uncultured Hymenobacter sp. TaxID=170016 RepID=UPI0035CBC338